MVILGADKKPIQCVVRPLQIRCADGTREKFVDDICGNDSNLLIVFYVQIMPDDFVMQLHRF